MSQKKIKLTGDGYVGDPGQQERLDETIRRRMKWDKETKDELNAERKKKEKEELRRRRLVERVLANVQKTSSATARKARIKQRSIYYIIKRYMTPQQQKAFYEAKESIF